MMLTTTQTNTGGPMTLTTHQTHTQDQRIEHNAIAKAIVFQQVVTDSSNRQALEPRQLAADGLSQDMDTTHRNVLALGGKLAGLVLAGAAQAAAAVAEEHQAQAKLLRRLCRDFEQRRREATGARSRSNSHVCYIEHVPFYFELALGRDGEHLCVLNTVELELQTGQLVPPKAWHDLAAWVQDCDQRSTWADPDELVWASNQNEAGHLRLRPRLAKAWPDLPRALECVRLTLRHRESKPWADDVALLVK